MSSSVIGNIFPSWIQKRIRAQPWPAGSFDLPRWQTHRGYWREGCRQNSLDSLIEARRRNSQMVEFDVRLTQDRIPILFHDETIDLEGHKAVPIETLSFEELNQQSPVTTLKEVLISEKVPPYLNIELKSEKILDEPLERFVAPLIRSCNAEKRVLFSSFNPFSLWKMSQWLPEVPRALLVSPDMEERSLREMWWAPCLSLHLLHLDQQMIDEASMEFWKLKEIPIAAWTVNDLPRGQQLLDWGVQSIISDLIPPLKPAHAEQRTL